MEPARSAAGDPQPDQHRPAHRLRRRNDELRQHVRGALRNGCTEEEIQEVLLQVAVYCGVPAGLEGTRQAQSVLDEPDP